MDVVYTIEKDYKGRLKVVCELTSGQGNVFRGQAICAVEDCFDPDLGMSLALNRAKEKQMKLIVKNRLKAYHEANALLAKAEKAYNKASDAEYKVWRDIYRQVRPRE
jgi:hypothetical protein